MSNIMLFGAGASYGSDDSGVPPLGSSLFDELARFNPDGWGQITGDYANAFRADFEAAMARIAPIGLAPLQRAMAAYFFRFEPRPTSLYVRLATRIAQTPAWAGATCTLNYERLLELALGRAGVRTFVGSPPDARRAVEMCLPHGSCHLFCSVMASSPGVRFQNVQTDGQITVVSDPELHRQRIRTDAFPPVMSYFEPSKHTTSGRSFIAQQRARWRELALAADRIVIIGVRVRPHDSHIWDAVAQTSARVIYCSGATGAPEYRTWAQQARPDSDDVTLPGHFSDQFDEICAGAGLG